MFADDRALAILSLMTPEGREVLRKIVALLLNEEPAGPEGDVRCWTPTLADVKAHAAAYPAESDHGTIGGLWMATDRKAGATPRVYHGEIIVVHDTPRTDFSFAMGGTRYGYYDDGHSRGTLWRALKPDGTPAPWPRIDQEDAAKRSPR